MEEIMIPKPSPNPAINRTSRGRVNAQDVREIADPRIKKNNQNARKKTN